MQTRVLIIQTAFFGDVILTLPLAQILKTRLGAEVDFLCIPKTSILVKDNPNIDNVIIFDKKGKDRGLKSFKRLIRKIKFKRYDYVFSPHRSLRSTLLSYFSKSEITVGFDTAALSRLFIKKVKYVKDIHEIQRNLKLLEPIGIEINEIIKPDLYFHEDDVKTVNLLLRQFHISPEDKFVTIAPGTIWQTKRFPEDKIIDVLDMLAGDNVPVVLTGSKQDMELCRFIIDKTKNEKVYNAASKLTILQSAYLIKKSKVILTNDSSPLHLANAVGTKVVAVFGATVPEFGFYPIGKNDKVIQTSGLKCRPCAIHGGNKCPIKTFVCMRNINPADVYNEIKKSLS
jgi:heptosyltransferase-2